MSILQRKLYRIETQLENVHRRISDTIESDFREHDENKDAFIRRVVALENIIDQLSINSRNNGTLHNEKLADVVNKSHDHFRAVAQPPLALDIFAHRVDELLWLVSAKASVHILSATLKVFFENVLLLDEEIHYWEEILASDWSVGLHVLQTSPLRAWRRWALPNTHYVNGNRSKRTILGIPAGARTASGQWPQFDILSSQCLSPAFWFTGFGSLSSLRGTKLEIQNKKRKLKAMRDYNARSIGLILNECLSFNVDIDAGGNNSSLTSHGLCQRVRANISLLKEILENADVAHATLGHADRLAGKSNDTSHGTQHGTNIKILDPEDILQEVTYILMDALPRFKSASVEGMTAFGRPSSTVRYWLPFLFTLASATTTLKIAKNAGPALIKSISDFGTTAVDFWKNWVVEPTQKLVRTIRHDEASDIALMSKNSLEADRASLERMVVDFVLDRGEQSQPTLSAQNVVDKVREGDLTPVLKAYEKDLRSPFIGTVRGDLVRALLIQIQKTKVDVEVAMNGIDALLKSQELVFGFVGLTPGLLISYASIRWFFGLLGNRRGFRLGRRQDDLRYALRKLHRILSKSGSTEEGRLDYRNHGLLICNAETLLGRARVLLRDEDFRALREDSSDLVDENRVGKQLQIIERMAWTYSKWMS